MPLLPTDEQWSATIDGAPWLECKFWMPAGSTEAQARYRAWLIWEPARAAGSNDPDFPVAVSGLSVRRIARAFVAAPDMARAA